MNIDGKVIDIIWFDWICSFDSVIGVIEVEVGCIIVIFVWVFVFKGWLFVVMLGIGFVMVGGCIVNDVYGKNYYNLGSFG